MEKMEKLLREKQGNDLEDLKEIARHTLENQLFSNFKESDSKIKSFFDGSFIDQNGYEIPYTLSEHEQNKLVRLYKKEVAKLLSLI